MIIYSLLFIIVLLFFYETFKKLYKLREEYFSNIKDYFIANPLSSNLALADISKTISINCKNYLNNINLVQEYEPSNQEELDTPYYAQFKPLEYNPKRQYYYRRDILISEGLRRSQDDKNEIASIQTKYDNENDPDKKQILQDELDSFKWRDNILSPINKHTKLNRTMRDITTDYYPEEIGMQRIWQEPHSHISDYSKSLNYGYKTYSGKQIY